MIVLFFFVRFNFISVADGGAASAQILGTTGSNGSSLTLANVKAPKNGYAYVYVSNRSDQSVYFVNFKVQVAAGNIIEENHYYAYGLKIAAISSVELGDGAEGGLQNNYQYQGAYSELDADIGWNDFALRNYDAQIGRWVQQDPYQEYASPYVGMGNDPINNVDPDGGGVLGLTPGLYTLTTTLVGAVIGGDVSAATGHSFLKGAAIGAAVGFAAGYIPSLVGGGVGKSLSHAVSILNVTVKAVGVVKDFSAKELPTILNPYTNSSAYYNVGLSNSEANTVTNALIFAKELLTKKLKEVNRWDQNDKNKFIKHYGTDDNRIKNIIEKRISNEIRLIKYYLKNNNFKKEIFRTKGGEKNRFARVFKSNNDHNIYLDELFWITGDVGTDSKAGVLIHEMSHFNDISVPGTIDGGSRFYGPKGAMDVMRQGDAVFHADSFEYYIEEAW